MTSNKSMETEVKARRRVERNIKLRQFSGIIFSDWPNWEEHMEWVATATVAEIISWAKATQS